MINVQMIEAPHRGVTLQLWKVIMCSKEPWHLIHSCLRALIGYPNDSINWQDCIRTTYSPLLELESMFWVGCLLLETSKHSSWWCIGVVGGGGVWSFSWFPLWCFLQNHCWQMVCPPNSNIPRGANMSLS